MKPGRGEAQGNQPIYDADVKQWVFLDPKPPTWARLMERSFRGAAVFARLSLLAFVVIAIAASHWALLVVALLLLALSVIHAWVSNKAATAEAKRRLWWP